jgi:2-aminomuconate deaminase
MKRKMAKKVAKKAVVKKVKKNIKKIADIKKTAKKNSKEIISSSRAPAPVGAYPHARRVGDLLFLSGVGPRRAGTTDIPGVYLDAMGNVLSYDIRLQTESVIENVRMILEDAGSSFEKIVDVQVFLTDMKRDFKIYNEIYAKHFKPIQATRTTIAITALPTPIAVEFKVIAMA